VSWQYSLNLAPQQSPLSYAQAQLSIVAICRPLGGLVKLHNLFSLWGQQSKKKQEEFSAAP